MSFKEKLEEVAAETLLTGGGIIPRWGTILTAVDNCEKLVTSLTDKWKSYSKERMKAF